MKATIDWTAVIDEPNTPLAEVTSIVHVNDSMSLVFRGREAGEDSVWEGSITLKHTVLEQQITGNYVVTPGPKISQSIQKIPYKLVGRFSDSTYTSFTGNWSEGATNQTQYELTIDILPS